MTSKEFVIWLKGFVAGSNNYNLTPQGWDTLKDELKNVNDYSESTSGDFQNTSITYTNILGENDIID